MSRTIADLQESTVIDDQDEILFYQNSTKVTKKVKRGNFFSSRGIVVRGRVIDPEGNDVGLAAAAAANDAAVALVSAQGAQATADGRNRIFYSDTAPTNPIGGYALRQNDIWYETDNGYKMSKWTGSAWEAYQLDDPALAGLNVGKLTAGFISSQVISILGNTPDSTQPAQCSGFIESNNFVPTWVSGQMTVRIYNGGDSELGKSSASDVVQVKVLQNDGKYKLFRSKVDQGANATGAPPSSGENTYWIEVAEGSIPTIQLKISDTVTKTVQNFGFRIVANGYAEFGGSLFRGAVIANEGFFGNKLDAVRIDSSGLTMSSDGRIKSAGIGYSGTDFTSSSGTGGSGGFFLGNTQAEGDDNLYQFFIGQPGGNNLRWNGTDLRVNAKVVGIGTGGLLDPDAEYGITIGSQYGIRRSVNNGTLTLSGGSENGIQRGAQIDLAGTELNTSASDTGNGILSLQAGYNSAYSFNGPRDGSIEFRTSLAVDNGDGPDLGVLRMRIDLDGQVNIFAGQTVAGDAPDGGAGKLMVDTEIVVREGATRNIVLKKLDGNGMIYLRDSDDSVTVTLDGGAGEITASSYNSTSSKRFKKKIKNLKNGLNLVTSLRPVTFDWKKKEKKDDIGLIAEEVYKILPSVVKLDEDDLPCAIDYSKLTPILIQAVKELYAEIHALKSKIKL
jgi:hypothetical protein